MVKALRWVMTKCDDGLKSSLNLSHFQKDLGDRMMPAFNTKSGVPYSDVNIKSGKSHAPRWGPDSSTSEVTTIQLEFNDLSYVTGDAKYKVSGWMRTLDVPAPGVMSCPDLDTDLVESCFGLYRIWLVYDIDIGIHFV